MIFKVVPILEKMVQFYEQARSRDRFEQYLKMLRGASKDDMVLPIAGYNPMGKENVSVKLKELLALEAEAIAVSTLERINAKRSPKEDRIIELVLNLVDDVGGAWSNHFTTDYTSKFQIQALVKRNFCAPHFWTSETFTTDRIRKRIEAYAYRTIYFIDSGKPATLKDHLMQEIFVQRNLSLPPLNIDSSSLLATETFYQDHLESDNYSLLFNFFYGDEASKLLGYPTFGLAQNAGFDYARTLAQKTAE